MRAYSLAMQVQALVLPQAWSSPKASNVAVNSFEVGLQLSALQAARRLFGTGWPNMVGCFNRGRSFGAEKFGRRIRRPIYWTSIAHDQTPTGPQLGRPALAGRSMRPPKLKVLGKLVQLPGPAENPWPLVSRAIPGGDSTKQQVHQTPSWSLCVA